MSYKLGVLFCTLLICSDLLALTPMLMSQNGDTCIYDDGSVIKSLRCPLRLKLERSVSPTEQTGKNLTRSGIVPTLRSQHGDTCIYDDGSVIKSTKCPFRLELEKSVSNVEQAGNDLRRAVLAIFGKETREVKQQRQLADLIANFDTLPPAEQNQTIAELQAEGKGDLAHQLVTKIQAKAQLAQEEARKKAFSTFLSNKYPDSGLDKLAELGIVTPENFKDFLTE